MSGGDHLVLEAVPASVPRARAFLRELPAVDGIDSFDVELILTELTANAVLHGGDPVQVSVYRGIGRVRVEVADGDDRLPTPRLGTADAMTGRGLGLVASLSTSWGIEPRQPSGKAVWAELVASGATAGASVPLVDLDSWADLDVLDDVPERRYRIDLGPVPTALLVAAKTHVENVVRELALAREMAENPDDSIPASAARLLETATGAFAEARAQLESLAVQARAAGDAETHVVLELPLSAADAADAYQTALDEADIYSRATQLLTPPAPASHAVLRRWYLEGLTGHLRAVAAGEEPPPKRSFVDAMEVALNGMASLHDEHLRLGIQETIAQAMVKAADVVSIGRAVLRSALELMGAHTCRLYLLHPDEGGGMLRSVAASGGVHDPVRFAEIPMGARLPAADVAATCQPLLLRSVAQIENTYPSLRGVYRSERYLHVAPLVAGARALGVLSVTYRPASRIDEGTRVSLVEALAAAASKALERVLD